MSLRLSRFVFCTGLSLTLSMGASAADIYRWTDDTGRTHLSDTVPERYRASAVKIDAARFQVPEAERQAALARAAREKEEQDRIAAEAARVQAQAERAAAERNAAVPFTPGPFAANKPADLSGLDCDGARQAYRASQECFAPYQRAYGRGVREEARSVCQPVADPSPRCGAPSK